MNPIARRAASPTVFAGTLLILSAFFGGRVRHDRPPCAARPAHGRGRGSKRKNTPGLADRTGTFSDMPKLQAKIRNPTFNLESVLMR